MRDLLAVCASLVIGSALTLAIMTYHLGIIVW